MSSNSFGLAEGFGVVLPISSTAYVDALNNCLASLKYQTGKHAWRPIIVLIHQGDYDDHDFRFNKLCREYNPVLIYHRASDTKGFQTPLARNMGASYSPFRWLLFSDCDLIYPPTAFESMAKVLQKGGCVRFAVRDRHEEPTAQIYANYREALATNPERAFSMLKQDALPRGGAAGSVAVPRPAWVHVRGYDEQMRGWGADDEDFVDRLHRAGFGWTGSDAWSTFAVHQFHYRDKKNLEHCEANRKRYFEGRDSRRIIVNEKASIGALTYPS